MKLTNKQKREIEVITYFTPSWVEFDPITDENIETFFNWSDKGIKYQIKPLVNDGLAALHFGKQYRDLQITSWKRDVEEGLISKYEILKDMPENVYTYVEKSISSAMLGRPKLEEVEGELVFMGYEKPDAVESRIEMAKHCTSEEDK